jgi:uncharacterized membrane protein YheB (UPF0754 family)
MNNIDDILAKLRAGATEEDIAKQLTDALNTAVQKKKEEDAALLERKNEKRIEKACKNAARILCEALADFFYEIGETDLADIFASMEAMNEIQGALEGIAELAKTNVLSNYVNLLKSLDGLRADDKPNRKDIDSNKIEEDIDDIFEKWLKEHGL